MKCEGEVCWEMGLGSVSSPFTCTYWQWQYSDMLPKTHVQHLPLANSSPHPHNITPVKLSSPTQPTFSHMTLLPISAIHCSLYGHCHSEFKPHPAAMDAQHSTFPHILWMLVGCERPWCLVRVLGDEAYGLNVRTTVTVFVTVPFWVLVSTSVGT